MDILRNEVEQAVFIDFDGTICMDRYWRSLPAEQHSALQSLLFGEDPKLANDWMRGNYTAEDVNQYAAEKLGIPYDELWQCFVSDCKTMYVSPELLAQLAVVRKTHVLVLMTGNMDSFHRFTVPALELENHFDYISNSYYERKHKTDINGELFTDWSSKLQIPLSKIHLIDDSATCCTFFDALGGTAHQTKGPEHTIEILGKL